MNKEIKEEIKCFILFFITIEKKNAGRMKREEHVILTKHVRLFFLFYETIVYRYL